MNIYDLIQQKCPNGVLVRKLSACCNVLDSQRQPVTESQRDAGEYPYYGASGVQDYISDYIFDGTFVLVGEDGSVITENGNPIVVWAEGKIWVNNHAHIISEIEDVSLRYLFFYLQTVDISNFVHGNIPKFTGKDFKNLQIPLPPLPVQREIVAILDKFDSYCNSMTAGLAGELEMRRKQYRYWAEHLVMDGNVEMVELGKLCRINKGTQMNKSDYQDGPYPIYNMGAEPSGTHTEYNRDIPSIVIAGHGNSCGFVNWVDEPFWAGGGCYYLDSLAPDLSNRYLYHAMKVREGFLMGLGSHGPIRNLYPRTIARLQVPVPVSVPGTGAWDIARQQSICDTLDKFLTLEHELEHELELRRKQYEYYRDMLLSFPERKENA